MNVYFKQQYNCATRTLALQEQIKKDNPAAKNDAYIAYLKKKVALFSAILNNYDTKDAKEVCSLADLLLSDFCDIIGGYITLMLDNTIESEKVSNPEVSKAARIIKDNLELGKEFSKALKEKTAYDVI